MYVCVYICVCVCVYLCMCMYACVYMYVRVHVCDVDAGVLLSYSSTLFLEAESDWAH